MTVVDDDGYKRYTTEVDGYGKQRATKKKRSSDG